AVVGGVEQPPFHPVAQFSKPIDPAVKGLGAAVRVAHPAVGGFWVARVLHQRRPVGEFRDILDDDYAGAYELGPLDYDPCQRTDVFRERFAALSSRMISAIRRTPKQPHPPVIADLADV